MIGKIQSNSTVFVNRMNHSPKITKPDISFGDGSVSLNLNDFPSAYYNKISFGKNKDKNISNSESTSDKERDDRVSSKKSNLISFFPEDLASLENLKNINEQIAYLVYLREQERYSESDDELNEI